MTLNTNLPLPSNKRDAAIQTSNLGSIFYSQNKVDKAIHNYRLAIKIDPSYYGGYYNLAIAQQEADEHHQAVKTFEAGLNNCEDHGLLLSAFIQLLYHICDWPRITRYTPDLDEHTKDQLKHHQQTDETPFLNMLRSTDPDLNRAVAASWSHAAATKAAAHSKSYPPHHQDRQKLRLGYLSADFRDHATSHLIARLFKLHDREHFNVYCYSTGRDDGSTYRQEVQDAADEFIDLHRTPPQEVADHIYQDHIDILVDLNGYTQGNQMITPALRPAPLILTYLGFPGTSGADFVDYLIADTTLIPDEHRGHYTEHIIYMPHSYQVNNDKQAFAKKKFTRQDCRLPQDAFVFASFNHNYKIDPDTFKIWMELLKGAGNSVLWLLESNTESRENLKAAAARQDIDANRLVFAPKLPKSEHLKRIQLADLNLDTLRVNGHTTTSDMLWAGIPTLTLKGRHFASRVSSSLLKAIGLPEMITTTATSYKQTAISLVKNPQKLTDLKARLQHNRQSTPLFDTSLFTNHLEAAYQNIWQRYQDGKPPKDTHINDI